MAGGIEAWGMVAASKQCAAKRWLQLLMCVLGPSFSTALVSTHLYASVLKRSRPRRYQRSPRCRGEGRARSVVDLLSQAISISARRLAIGCQEIGMQLSWEVRLPPQHRDESHQARTQHASHLPNQDKSKSEVDVATMDLRLIARSSPSPLDS